MATTLSVPSLGVSRGPADRPRQWLPVIKATCAEYFGTRTKKYADNRCSSCPLHDPCMKHGRCPARTIEELDASREVFERESLEILAVR